MKIFRLTAIILITTMGSLHASDLQHLLKDKSDMNSFLSLNNQSNLFYAGSNIDSGSAHDHDAESAFRRGEIIFFLALPFVLLSHFVVVGSINSAQKKQFDFDMSSQEMAFIASSTLLVTSALTYNDYRAVQQQNEAEKEKHSSGDHASILYGDHEVLQREELRLVFGFKTRY